MGVLRGGPLTEDYHVVQIHWHWGKTSAEGSEHTYKGQTFPLEMHIVHVKSGLPSPALENFAKYSDGLAVTGFMFNVGVRYSWCSKESDPV